VRRHRFYAIAALVLYEDALVMINVSGVGYRLRGLTCLCTVCNCTMIVMILHNVEQLHDIAGVTVTCASLNVLY
jgi:hypothetical protein